MLTALAALIDEENCIGCSKCIRVCPTDAIVGAKHQLHTVITQLCTSCEECINACPTNCIVLKTPIKPIDSNYEQQLKQHKQERLLAKQRVAVTQSQPVGYFQPEQVVDSRQQQIADAIARVKARKALK